MPIHEFALLALSSLFVIVDPLALVPAYLAMTHGDSVGDRLRTARIACLVAAVVLMGFAAGGTWLFRLLGLTVPAFQIAGSILLMVVALDMLRARTTEVRQTRAETTAAAEKDDVAVSPLAVPMLAGPGACSAVLLLQNRAADDLQRALVYPAIAVVCVASYLVLGLAAHHADRLRPIAMRVVTRLMGLLLAAIAVQFFLDGVAASGLLRPPP